MNKPRKGVQVPVDLLQRQRQRSTRRIVTPVGDEVLRQFNAEQRAIQYGKNFDQIQVNLQDVEFVGDDVFLNRKFSKTPKPALLLETVNIDGKDFYFFNETDSRRLLDERIRKKLEIKDQRRQREITKKYQTQQQKTQQPQGKINRNNFKSAGAMGRQSYPPGFEYELIRPSIFERGRSALSQTADFLSPKNLKGLFKTKSKQFLKPVKEFLGQGIKNIPFIGDLIGILLDVFVFGEPIQRALFLAGGSALGGFLGDLAGAIGGPPGILIGGIIGGIAGDLLGGAFYDLLFRRGQKGSAGQRFGASATKASIKAGLYTGGFAGYGTYMLGEGGREFVLDADSTAALERRSPGFLMALNKARGAEAIGVIEDYASYDKISTGKEKMVPIPIPIPQKESSVQEIIMTDSEAGGGTGGGFITFLSEHYRRG